MVFGFGLGQRRRRVPEDPTVVARAEVKFWKTELDRCVEEKQLWIERCANAARQNEVLRTEVYLLQQDVGRLHDVLSVPGSSKPSLATPPQHHHRHHHRDQNSTHHHTPGRSHPTQRGVPATVPHVSTSRQHASRPAIPTPPPPPAPEPDVDDDEIVDFTPAAKRFQSPCSTGAATGGGVSNSRPSQLSRDEAARWRDEANSLRKYLQESRSLNESLRQQLTQQQHRAEFLRSTAEAYKNEAQQLQDKLLTSHGLNDETADETVKLLADLGRLQQTNALLKRDLALKEGMIQLLQQQLAELSSQMLPHTPRSGRGRSAERDAYSTSECSRSPDGRASPRLHAPACADGGGAMHGHGDSDAFHSSSAAHSVDSYAFHTLSDEALGYMHHTAADVLGLASASLAHHSPSRLSLSSRNTHSHTHSRTHSRPRSQPHSRAHSRPPSARPSRGTDVDHPPAGVDPDADLELAGLVAVHAAMYRHEKEALRQSQQQLEAVVQAARYEVAAHEAGWGQVLDGLTSERLNAMAARWKPPKPRSRSWREPEGLEIDPASLLVPGAKIPCGCGDECDEETPLGLGSLSNQGASGSRGAAATTGKTAGKPGAEKGAGASSAAAPRAPPRQQLGARLAKDSAFAAASFMHVEPDDWKFEIPVLAKYRYQQPGGQSPAAVSNPVQPGAKGLATTAAVEPGAASTAVIQQADSQSAAAALMHVEPAGEGPKAPADLKLGYRRSGSQFATAALMHFEPRVKGFQTPVAAKPGYQQAGSQFAAAKCALERKTSPVFDAGEDFFEQAMADTVVAGMGAAGTGSTDAGVAGNRPAGAGTADVGVTDTEVVDTGPAVSADAEGADTGVVDKGSADTGADMGMADKGSTDTGPDTELANNNIGAADTGVADKGSTDTRADTGVADKGSAETGADTEVADKGSADTGGADMGMADKGSAETGGAETGVTDKESAETGGAETGSGPADGSHTGAALGP